MKTSTKLRIAAICLLLAAVSTTVPAVYLALQTRQAVSAAPSTPVTQAVLPTTPQTVTGNPVKIAIASVGVDLPVINGYYNAKTGNWTLTNTSAQYATPTVTPNNTQGNTLLYGHAISSIFGNLYKLRTGDTAVVTTDNGYQFTYVYQSTEVFEPTNTSVFSYTGAPRLTLQTCSGTFSQHRQMYYFVYQSYAKM